MAKVIANRVWFFADGITTAGSSTVIARGVDTSLIVEGDLTAAGVELDCVTGIVPNPSVNKEDVYCAVAAGASVAASTASYSLNSSPTLTSKNELVVTLAEVSPLVWSLFYSTDLLAVGTPEEVNARSGEISGLASIIHYDSNASGAQLARSWFWTEATLTGMNTDQAVAKPQITMNVLANGVYSPIEIF